MKNRNLAGWAAVMLAGAVLASLGPFARAEPPPGPATATAISTQPPPAAASGSPAAAAPADERTFLDVQYAAPDGVPVKLDLFLPRASVAPSPVVIWVHGGGWRAGSKKGCPAVKLVDEGFAVASVEYRFTNVAPFPAQINDVKAAVRFLRASAKTYNLDPDRFGAWGASAGGHLVALLGTSCGSPECEGALGNAEQSSAVQCVCDWFGPADFTEYKAHSVDVAPMLVALFGGPMSQKQGLVKLASPALHIKKQGGTYPAFLIQQGDADPLVPWQQSQLLADKLKEAGAAVDLVIVKGAGHGFGASTPAELARVRAFFLKHLGPKPAAAETPAKSQDAPPSAPPAPAPKH